MRHRLLLDTVSMLGQALSLTTISGAESLTLSPSNDRLYTLTRRREDDIWLVTFA